MIQQDARVARAHKQIVRTMLSRSSTHVMPATATNMHNEARTTMIDGVVSKKTAQRCPPPPRDAKCRRWKPFCESSSMV